MLWIHCIKLLFLRNGCLLFLSSSPTKLVWWIRKGEMAMCLVCYVWKASYTWDHSTVTERRAALAECVGCNWPVLLLHVRKRAWLRHALIVNRLIKEIKSRQRLCFEVSTCLSNLIPSKLSVPFLDKKNKNRLFSPRTFSGTITHSPKPPPYPPCKI